VISYSIFNDPIIVSVSVTVFDIVVNRVQGDAQSKVPIKARVGFLNELFSFPHRISHRFQDIDIKAIFSVGTMIITYSISGLAFN